MIKIKAFWVGVQPFSIMSEENAPTFKKRVN